MTERGEIVFGSTVIGYTVSRSARRRKTVEIALDPYEGVLVTTPNDLSLQGIEGIVAQHAPWIIRRGSAGILQPRPKSFVSGESLPYLGRQTRLFVEHANVPSSQIRFRHWSFNIVAPSKLSSEERRSAIRRALTGWYRARAAARLEDRAARWSKRMGRIPAAILIREQRHRWASCARDGTLRFNWRIIMAPPLLIDYVVVHELVHLGIPNHSPAFWTEIARVMPDYKVRRARLKEIGPWLSV